MNFRPIIILVTVILLLPAALVESADADSNTYSVTTGYALVYEESLDQKYTYGDNCVSYTIMPDTGKIVDQFGNEYLYNSLSNTFWSHSEMMNFYDSDYNDCFDIGCYISEDGKKGYFVHDDVYYYSKNSENNSNMLEFIHESNKSIPVCDYELDTAICMYKIEQNRDKYLYFNGVDHRDENKVLIEPSALRYNKIVDEDVSLLIESNDKTLRCYPSTTYRGDITENGIPVGETTKLDYYNGLLSLKFTTENVTENLNVDVSITTSGLKSVEDTGDNNPPILIASIILIIICVALLLIIELLKYRKK